VSLKSPHKQKSLIAKALPEIRRGFLFCKIIKIYCANSLSMSESSLSRLFKSVALRSASIDWVVSDGGKIP